MNALRILAVVGLLPQVAKLVRTRVPDGVSITWASFGVVTNTTWAAYLASQQLWLALPSVVLVSVAYVATFLVLARLGAPSGRAVGLGIAWTAVLAATGLAAGWTALGAVLGFSYIVQVAPGLWVAFRTPHPDGISPATWTIAMVEGALWGYYGWWHGDLPVMLFAVIASSASVAMLARYAVTRRRPTVEVAPASS